MVALVLAALFVGFALGVAWDHRLVSYLRAVRAARPDPEGSLRHTIDHRCSPPYSHWSVADDSTCFVEVEHYGEKVMPGDVWVCSCFARFIARDGQWNRQAPALEEGATP